MSRTEETCWLAPGEYHECSVMGDSLLLRTGDGKCFYYNALWQRCVLYNYAEPINSSYLFAETKDNFVLIEIDSDRVLWSCGKDDERFPLGRPCFSYLGTIDGLPLLEDATYSRTLAPIDGKLQWLDGCRAEHPALFLPIVLNGENVADIVWDDNALGIISL